MTSDNRNDGDDLIDYSDLSSMGLRSEHDGTSNSTTSRSVRRAFSSTGLVRLLVGLLIVGGWWLFTGLDDASRDDSGQIVGGGDLDVADMVPGDCFNDPENLEDSVTHVAAVPCSEPHDNEVFAVSSVGSSLGDRFPGIDVLDRYTYESCIGPFESYTGEDYTQSSLEVYAFFPTKESWDQGDRGFSCVLYALDFSRLTGSVRDNGL